MRKILISSKQGTEDKMGKFHNYKIKKYSKLKQKYPNVDYVYRLYKFNNLYFHEHHKIKSWLFLLKLLRENRKKKDLLSVKFPKGTYNPLLTMSTQDVFNVKTNDSCLAIPDSQLMPRKNPKELAKELAKYDVISFDVFDTCIFRPFSKPTDLFYL